MPDTRAKSTAEEENLSQQLNSAVQEIERLRLSLEKANSGLQASKAKIATLQRSNLHYSSLAREDLTKLEQERNNAVVEAYRLEILLDLEKSKSKNAQKSVKALESKVKKLKAKLKECADEVENLQSNASTHSVKNESQAEQIELLQQALKAMRTENQKISLKLSDKECQNTELHKAIQNILVKLGNLDEHGKLLFKEIEADFEAVQAEKPMLVQQMQRLEQELHGLRVKKD